MKKILSIALCGVMCFSVAAYGQTPDQSAKFADSLSTLVEKLDESGKNLLDMAYSLPAGSTDQETLLFIQDNLMFTGAVIGKVEILAVIHSSMESPKDQLVVKRYLNISAEHASGVSERAVSNVNRKLVSVKSAAAIAEMQKIRDLLQSIGKELRPMVQSQ